MTVLFVNACLRGEESRTLTLCREYLEGVEDVKEVNLAELKLEPYYAGPVAFRAQLEANDRFDDALFDLAKDFAEADEIVIGAPYWDLSFPAALKIYVEHVCAMGITFHYTDQGACEGLCKAGRLTYITTCGGRVEGMNFGYEYFCGIAKMFGIPETRFVAAENLDVVGNDNETSMAVARRAIAELRAEG